MYERRIAISSLDGSTTDQDLGALRVPEPLFEVGLAKSEAEVAAAQRLRYAVFVEELGAQGPMVDHDTRRERDRFDDHAEQLILWDRARPAADQVVGVYRLMDDTAARAAGQFYSESEYDLTPLRASGRPLLELGRSCLHPDYRGGAAMLHLWQALAQEVERRGAEVLFGVASFPGVDVGSLSEPLSLLARDHLAPPELRGRARAYQPMVLTDRIDRLRAMKEVPALIKAYLRLGGFVGDGAFVDHDFKTIDVLVVLDRERMSERQRAIYRGRA